LMRSTAAAALLTACGLCAPVGPDSWIRRFDSVFVRGASSDVPSEGKSAFGAEMGDIAALLRSCGQRSLVFVDELGRGTSPRDGTSLAGAVLEAMAIKGMCGFFATHLHGILRLPLKADANARLIRKRMAINENALGDQVQNYGWTYKIEDGICTDSLAMKTAERFGLPKDVLNRAGAFSVLVNDVEIVSSLTDQESQDKPASTVNCVRRKERKPRCEIDPGIFSLCKISTIVEEMVKAKAFLIPPTYMPPAQIAGCPCVYVLEVDGGTSVNQEIPRSRFYVGQTANLPNRLTQHRKKGKEWKMLSAIAIPIEGGTDDARNVERCLIRELSRLGYELISWADG